MIFRGEKIFDASFDDYAKNYDDVRPGYPDSLFSRINESCSLTDDSLVLEIGAGSGIATEKISQLICKNIVALEPGENLIKVARTRIKTKGVKFVCDTFENYSDNPEERFDVIAAFTSLHWLKGVDSMARIEKMLKDDGILVVVWNSFFQKECDVTTIVNGLYHKMLPDIYPNSTNCAGVNKAALEKLDHRISKLACDGFFRLKSFNYYVTECRYNCETYPKLLMTFPKIAKIDSKRRDEFLEQVKDAILSHNDNITVPVVSSLLILEKRKDFLSSIAQ